MAVERDAGTGTDSRRESSVRPSARRLHEVLIRWIGGPRGKWSGSQEELSAATGVSVRSLFDARQELARVGCLRERWE